MFKIILILKIPYLCTTYFDHILPQTFSLQIPLSPQVYSVPKIILNTEKKNINLVHSLGCEQPASDYFPKEEIDSLSTDNHRVLRTPQLELSSLIQNENLIVLKLYESCCGNQTVVCSMHVMSIRQHVTDLLPFIYFLKSF